MKDFFSSIIISVLSFFGLYNAPEPSPIVPGTYQVEEAPAMNVGADGSTFTGGQTFRLSGSGVTSSATSIGLTSFTLAQTGQELTTADVAGSSGSVYLTIEPGNTTRQEFVSCTTVTQSGSDATATLSGCSRGLSSIAPYTASTTQQFAHAGGSAVIISNSPAFYNQFAGKSNDETITGTWDFSTSPTVPTPTTGTQAVNKSYVDGGILAGAATSTESVTGISRLATKLQQASSTPTTANTPLVIQAQNATTTYNAGAAGGNGLNVVVTENDNKIDSDFLRQSDVFSWSGNNTHSGTNLFTASTTHTATTSIAASSVTNNALVINGVPLQFPATQGASSTVLANNGSGVLTSARMQSFATGATTTATITGSYVFGHDLGATPKMIKISVANTAYTGTLFAGGMSVGTATSTATASQNMVGVRATQNNTVGNAYRQTSLLISAESGSGTVDLAATLSAWDSTTFTLNITTNTATNKFVLWELYQ